MIYGRNDDRLDDLPNVVNETVKNMRPYIKHFYSIAVRGASGLLVGGPVSIRLDVPLVVVRKPGERHHLTSRPTINSYYLGDSSVFLDDFRSTGKTETAVRKVVRRQGGNIDACYFYSDDQWCEPFIYGPELRVWKCEHERRAQLRKGQCGMCGKVAK